MNQPADYRDLEIIFGEMHWWYRGRRKILSRMIDPIQPYPPEWVDIGSGAARLSRSAGIPSSRYYIDLHPGSLMRAAREGLGRSIRADATRLPLKANSIGLVTAFDLLEHIEDDRSAVIEWARVIRPGGSLLLSVPAYKTLFGGEDIYSGHLRRYDKASLLDALRGAGLKVRYITHFNTLLFPPAALLIILSRMIRGKTPRSNVRVLPGILNELLYRIFSLEALLVPRFRLPFGLSILCRLDKPARPPR